MKVKYFFIIGIVVVLSACRQEDDLQPSNQEVNYFVPADGEQSSEARLRSQFFKETGVYLMFNDTLSTKDGSVHKVDLGYSLTANSGYEYRMDYITEADSQRIAADFIKDSLLIHLGPGLRPYSLLLTNSIEYYNASATSPRWTATDFVSTWNCMAISLGSVLQSDFYYVRTYFWRNLAYSLVDPIIKARDNDFFAEFYAFSVDYVDQNKSTFGHDNVRNDSIARSYGFLADYYTRYYPSRIYDRNQYIQAAITYSEEDFLWMFGDCPLVMAKYECIRRLIESIGYIF